MNILFIGASGSGKGTQAKILAKKYNLCHISSGDVLREYREKGTEAGKIASEYMEAGKWVPIEIIVALINEKIADTPNANGFILDGFPRNLEQAKLLTLKLDIVINMVNNMEGLVKRLTNRRTCKDCEGIFSLNTLKDGECPTCSGEVYQRTDDNEKTIRARFDSYEKETRPVIDYYRKKGIVFDIDADQKIEDVTKQIESVIKNDINKN